MTLKLVNYTFYAFNNPNRNLDQSVCLYFLSMYQLCTGFLMRAPPEKKIILLGDNLHISLILNMYKAA